jgi:6-pyruvoyltetrahydropterin/6-carboxytetrahydropterin synthase
LATLHAAAAGFEAARQLHGLPAGHPAARLHGHGFMASVRCALPAGWAAFPGGEVERLRDTLAAHAARLDHRLLNEQVAEPSDANLARWLRAQLVGSAESAASAGSAGWAGFAAVPGITHVGVRSTARTGVDLDGAGRVHVWRRYAVQSAHRLPHVPLGHKCGRMHGHGFEIIVRALQDGPDGAIDHDMLDAVWAPLHVALNHACLNDLPGLDNPTSEVLAAWLWGRLAPQLATLTHVTVYETASCGASFDGTQHRIWKDFTLDSALRLKRAPPGSAPARLHGHTYTLRLQLAAPLDTVLGWTVDFGDVKALFDPIFRAIDHQPLHEIEGLADCDTASLAAWVLGQARAGLPQLQGVALFETPGCGAIVTRGDGGPALPV